MERFASGLTRHYYGKGDVVVYRLDRADAAPLTGRVFGAKVQMLVYGEAFWPTYTTGDNTGLVATDSMKNFIQRETLHFVGSDLRDTAGFSAHASSTGIRRSKACSCQPSRSRTSRWLPASDIRRRARNTRRRASSCGEASIVEAVSGLRGFRLLRLRGSAFRGFVRDEYTTLPDLANRPLHMWLDLDWQHTDPEHAFGDDQFTARARTLVREIFEAHESGSIQQVIHRIGTALLEDSADAVGGASRGAEPDVGYDCRARRARPLRGSEPTLRLLGPEAQTIVSRQPPGLSTHVLDTARGMPAAGIRIEVHRLDGNGRQLIATATTNAAGRTDTPLVGGRLEPGTYELTFGATDYFRSTGVPISDPPFLGEVVVRIGIADPTAHYHVPLLLSPYGYSTYRGS